MTDTLLCPMKFQLVASGKVTFDERSCEAQIADALWARAEERA